MRLRWRTDAGLRAQARELPIEGQVLLLVTLALAGFGQVMVYSASSPLALQTKEYGNDPLFFVKHGALFTMAGIVLMLVAMRMRPRWLRVLAPILLIASIALLVALLIPGVARETNGARRWLTFGPISIQPAELAKLALLGTIAAILTARRRVPRTFGELVNPYGVLTGIVVVLILVEPDLGSALSVAIMALVVFFVAGVPGRVLGIAASLGTLAVSIAIYAEPYRRARFLAFLDPWSAHNAGDSSYQVVQAMIGFGSGGLTGRGLGESVQKWDYLPEAHTDMIFAIIGEELGLVGALLVVAAFGVIAWAGFRIALASHDAFSRFVAAGITGQITAQAAINLGAVTGIMPLTGIPLPLISYGSSSRLVTLLSIGVLLSICRDVPPVRARNARRPPTVDVEAPRARAAS